MCSWGPSGGHVGPKQPLSLVMPWAGPVADTLEYLSSKGPCIILHRGMYTQSCTHTQSHVHTHSHVHTQSWIDKTLGLLLGYNLQWVRCGRGGHSP